MAREVTFDDLLELDPEPAEVRARLERVLDEYEGIRFTDMSFFPGQVVERHRGRVTVTADSGDPSIIVSWLLHMARVAGVNGLVCADIAIDPWSGRGFGRAIMVMLKT